MMVITIPGAISSGGGYEFKKWEGGYIKEIRRLRGPWGTPTSGEKAGPV